MTPLRADAAKWAAMPVRARRLVIEYFIAEAENSEHDAKCKDSREKYHPDDSQQESREDAKAFRAAVALLRSASPQPRRRAQ